MILSNCILKLSGRLLSFPDIALLLTAAELRLYPITVKGPSGEQLELQVFEDLGSLPKVAVF